MEYHSSTTYTICKCESYTLGYIWIICSRWSGWYNASSDHFHWLPLYKVRGEDAVTLSVHLDTSGPGIFECQVYMIFM